MTLCLAPKRPRNGSHCSLPPGTATARSDFSDTSPSLASLGRDFFFLPGGFCYPAGNGSAAVRRTMLPNSRRVIYKVGGGVKWSVA